MTEGPQQLIDRLVRATNSHDLDAVAACFAADYQNETPLHPTRGFQGRDQVRRNWEQIFAFVPDVKANVVRHVADGDSLWTEWEMTGTRRDLSSHHLRGVIIFGVTAGEICWARFYLEPVDEDAGTVDDAVREQVVRR